MNPTTSAPDQAVSSSPTMTAGGLFQQFSNPVANLNAAVVAAAQQVFPKNNISTLFTVEQLELIRRLRMTGISADAVLEAFQTLEKIESDLGASNVQSLALAALMGTPPKLFAHEALKPAEVPPVISTTSPTLLQHLSTQAFSNTSGMPPLSAPLTTPMSGIETPRTPPNLSPEHRTFTTVPFASTAADVSLFFPNLNQQLSNVPATSSATPSTSINNNAGGRPIRSQRTPMKEITTLDDPSELDEFMAQGEEGCINDMKQFITQFSLRQTTVAMMTGVSQPYISKLLNGNHRELSLRCRKNIYSWYLNCRRHPEKLAVFLQDPSTRLETNGDGELIPQRRERYVFRPILIKILENFFAEMPFPDYSKRVEIAAACNSALQMDKKGAGLMPKEVVSPQVVANWFANKRKEMRRRSNEDPQVVGKSATQTTEEQNLPSPPTSGSNSSPVDPENTSSDFFGNQFESFKTVFNLNNLYLKQKQEPMEVVSQPSGSPPSSAELDKISNSLLQSLLASQNSGFNFSKIEQTAE